MKSTCATPQRLLETISTKFSNSLNFVLIRNIFTSIVNNRTLPSQSPLRIPVRNFIAIFNYLYDDVVNSINNEVWKFKKSPAVLCAKDDFLHGFTESKKLFQVITVFWITDMSSQNSNILYP